MRPWTSFLLAVIMAMTPAMKSAFSQIAGVEVLSGIVDLREADQLIMCWGIKDGVAYEVTSRWVAGRPAWISYQIIGWDHEKSSVRRN